MNEWISVENELPPQKWSVIVKNGKLIVHNVRYHYKKWHHWGRKLHRVTHWRYSDHCKPSIPIKDMNAYFRRAQKYRDQMKKREFKTGGIIGLNSAPDLKPQSALAFIKEMENGMD